MWEPRLGAKRSEVVLARFATGRRSYSIAGGVEQGETRLMFSGFAVLNSGYTPDAQHARRSPLAGDGRRT